MNHSTAFVTSRVAADQLGVSLRTVQLWVESGALRAWKTAGGHRRIAKNSVSALLQKQRDAISNGGGDQGFTVVVVEDEAVQREIYKIKFEEWALPIKVVTTENGYEGLLAVGLHKPNVVISDLDMPGMDGFHMIKAITQDKALTDTRVVVVTGLSESEIAARGGLPKDIRVFTKPVDFDELKLLLPENEGVLAL